MSTYFYTADKNYLRLISYNNCNIFLFFQLFLTSTKYLDKSDSYRLLDAWLGTKGLLTSDGNILYLNYQIVSHTLMMKKILPLVCFIFYS